MNEKSSVKEGCPWPTSPCLYIKMPLQCPLTTYSMFHVQVTKPSRNESKGGSQVHMMRKITDGLEHYTDHPFTLTMFISVTMSLLAQAFCLHVKLCEKQLCPNTTHVSSFPKPNSILLPASAMWKHDPAIRKICMQLFHIKSVNTGSGVKCRPCHVPFLSLPPPKNKNQCLVWKGFKPNQATLSKHQPSLFLLP